MPRIEAEAWVRLSSFCAAGCPVLAQKSAWGICVASTNNFLQRARLTGNIRGVVRREGFHHNKWLWTAVEVRRSLRFLRSLQHSEPRTLGTSLVSTLPKHALPNQPLANDLHIRVQNVYSHPAVRASSSQWCSRCQLHHSGTYHPAPATWLGSDKQINQYHEMLLRYDFL